MKNVISKKQRFNYTKERLMLAVEEALSGRSVAEVSRKYNVPESTIRSKKIGKYADKKPGPATVLSIEEEKNLVEWLFHCSKRGFPITKFQLIDSVQLLCNNDKRKTPFVDNKPGRSWYEGFLNRNDNVSEILTENISIRRAEVSEYLIRSWFSAVSDYLETENLFGINANRIFSLDETRVPMNPKSPVVLTSEGNNVYNIVNNNEKENITVMLTGNAAGDLAPPYVLCSGQTVPKDITRVAPANYGFGFSNNGRMTVKNFYEYIVDIFHPWLEKSGIELPIILYINGHASNLTFPLSKFCNENQIILIGLCPNSTRILQPMDSFFRTLKMAWHKAFKSFCKKSGIMNIKKWQFSLVLQETLASINVEEVLKNSFTICGLYPLNVNAVDFKKVCKTSETVVPTEVVSHTEAIPEVLPNFDSLKILESVIADSKLQQFRAHEGPVWTGRIEDTSLFEIWYKLANSVTLKTEPIDPILDSHNEDMEYSKSFDFAPDNNFTNSGLNAEDEEKCQTSENNSNYHHDLKLSIIKREIELGDN